VVLVGSKEFEGTRCKGDWFFWERFLYLFFFLSDNWGINMKRLIILVLAMLLGAGLVIAADADGDTIEDNVDNCYNYYNPDQQDSNDDGLGDACDVVEHTVYLSEGWNLVSFPLNFGLITAKSLNETMEGTLDSIFFYYRNETYSGWYSFPATSGPALNVFDPSYGFWMKMKGPVNLTLRAPKIYSGTQKMYAGWNLIGYPWSNMSLEDAFNDEFNYPNAMYVYDGFLPRWLSWVYNKPPTLNGFNEAVPGYGIWVLLREDKNWTVNNGIIS